MSLDQLDAFVSQARHNPSLAARLAEPLELDDFLALAASEGFAIDADDVIAAQQREDERCSDSELQRQAGAEARRLRHFVYG
jgi:predicted ribosomally synthesized peptide with nif11-like leader